MRLVRSLLAIGLLFIALQGGSHAAAPAGAWWNTSYPYRHKISIAAGTSALASGYSVSINTFDHAAAVTTGRSLASGNDVRIVYWNGSAWVELNRVLEPQSSWNSNAPQIWFRTQANIAANGTSDNYYLYFGNVSAAGTPPTDANLVFRLFDDFDAASVNASLWTQSGASVSVSGGVLTLPASASIRSVATFGQSTIFDSSLRLPSPLPGGGSKFFYYWTATSGSNSVGFYADTSTHRARNTNPGTTQVALSEGDTTVFRRFSFARESSTVTRYWIGGAQVAALTANVPSGNLPVYALNDANGNRTQQYDWMRVRAYRNPEPTPALGTLEQWFDASHFVITHDGIGVNCGAETVTVSIRDINNNPLTTYSQQMTLDTQSGRGTWARISGTGTLTDSTPNDGRATYQWVAGQATATFSLTYPEGPQQIDIDAYQSNDAGVRDDDSEGPMQFAQSQFVITRTALGANQNPPFPSFATQRTAGNLFDIHIAKYGATPNDANCRIITSYSGAKPLTFWSAYVDPSSGFRPLTLTATDGSLVNIANTEGASTFIVNFTNGRAVISGMYKDVGLISFAVKDAYEAGLNPPVDTRGGSGNFVMKPAYFDVVAEGNTAPATATGLAFKAAGEPFKVTATARASGGEIAKNFGRESTPESVVLVPAAVQAAELLNGAPATGIANFANGTVAGSFDAFEDGVATSANTTWSEVGIVRFTARIRDGNYLDAGNITGVPSGNIGRFTPADFLVEMQTGSFGPSCGSFSYVGQPLKYVSPLLLRVTARNRDGARTTNYRDLFFRLGTSSIAGREYSAASSIDSTVTRMTTHPESRTDEWVFTDLKNGRATLSFSTGSNDEDGLIVERREPRIPFRARIQLSFELTDLDSVKASTVPVRIGTTSGIPFTDSEQRYGRLAFRNVVGSERMNLPMPLRVEYYASDATGFNLSTSDTCSKLQEPKIAFSAYAGHLQDGEVAAASIADQSVAGDFGLVLRAPGEGNDGRVRVEALAPDWLKIWNPATSTLTHPWGVATFGLFQGNNRRVYQREVY